MGEPVPAIFLDRDGTIIVEKNYLSDPAQVELEQEAGAGLRDLAGQGFLLVGITNQSGVGRGYFTLDAVHAVNQRVTEQLGAEGVHIAGWYICPHAPHEDCLCRKPRPQLLHQACGELSIDLTRSWVIGDKDSDVLLAEAVGAKGILVTTGHGARQIEWARAHGHPVASGLAEAARIIAAASAP